VRLMMWRAISARLYVMEPSSLETTSSLRWGDLGKFEARLKSYEQGEMTEVDWLDR
jgi:hypothetical protein